MTVTKSEKNIIVSTLLNNYKEYSVVNEKFLYEVLNKIIEKNEDIVNPIYELPIIMKKEIDYRLCMMAKKDEDVLLQLMIDSSKVMQFLAGKFKFKVDDPKFDEFLKDALLAYDGSVWLPSWIVTSFLKCYHVKYSPSKSYKIFKFNGKNIAPTVLKTVDGEQPKKYEFVYDSSVFANVVESPVETDSVTEEVFDNPINVVVDNTPEVENESISEIIEVVDVPLVVESVPRFDPFERYVSLISQYVNNGQMDSVVRMFKYLQMDKYIDSKDNDLFTLYLLLRFGFRNNKFYSLNDISSITGIDYDTVKSFEKFIVLEMKKIINKSNEKYITLELK